MWIYWLSLSGAIASSTILAFWIVFIAFGIRHVYTRASKPTSLRINNMGCFILLIIIASALWSAVALL